MREHFFTYPTVVELTPSWARVRPGAHRTPATAAAEALRQANGVPDRSAGARAAFREVRRK